jgi:uridylate kinase
MGMLATVINGMAQGFEDKGMLTRLQTALKKLSSLTLREEQYALRKEEL